MTSKRQQQESGLGGGPDRPTQDGKRAAELVREADRLIADVIKPGRWPQRRTVERFLEADRLERVLALYSEAIRLEPAEPAYPWNLASALNRLGLNELALAFIERAIRVAHESGDDEWAGAGAHLAWADMATSAGHYDTALLALAKAKSLAGGSASALPAIRALRDEVERRTRQPRPEHALAEKLEALSA